MADMWDGFYLLLRDVAKMPLDKEKMRVGYVTEDGSSLSLAWPDVRIGLAFENDIYDRKVLEGKGWKIFKLHSNVLVGLSPLLEVLQELIVERELQSSINKAHMTVSRIENDFLRKMLAAGIPAPDRNFKVFDDVTNKLISVPDFAWFKIGDKLVKTAVEVDGVYWHALKDNHDLAKRYADDSQLKKNVDTKTKIAHKHDSIKRRELQSRGWRVIPLSTEDLEENMDSAVLDVKKILREQAGKLNATNSKQILEAYKDSQ